MRKRVFALACVAALSAAAVVMADKVEFNNGDVLTGKITNYDGKKLTIKTDTAGDVKVNLKDVKTFSTDEPIDIRLNDGTAFNRRAVPATQGAVGVEKGDIDAQSFTLDKIKAINPPPVAWHGSVVLGAQISRGNTHTDRYSAAFDLNRRSESDRFTSSGQYSFGRERDNDTGDINTSADNWEVKAKHDHFWTEKWYGFVNVLVGKDRIQDLNLRFIPGVGVGYQWVESPDFNFNTEAGLAWVYEDYETQATKDDISLRLAYHFDKKFNDKVGMFHNLEYLPSIEDIDSFLVKADVGVRADLTQALFIEGKIEWTHNSDPAPGNDKNDTKYTLGVGWRF